MHLSTPLQPLAPFPPASPVLPSARRPMGWEAHPAGTADRHADEPIEPLSFTALRAIADGLARVQRSVPFGDEDPTVPRSARLLATTVYDVWLITWPDGSGLAAHHHGEARSVLQVVEGELIETIADHRRKEPPRSRLLRADGVTRMERSVVHEIANRSGGEATTIHVYSPPLAEVTFFNLGDPDEPHQVRTATVEERVPQASSPDLVVVGSHPRPPRGPDWRTGAAPSLPPVPASRRRVSSQAALSRGSR